MLKTNTEFKKKEKEGEKHRKMRSKKWSKWKMKQRRKMSSFLFEKKKKNVIKKRKVFLWEENEKR